MAQQLLDFRALVGDPGQGAEISGRQSGRHADLPYGRWIHWWRADNTIGSLHGAQLVDRLGCADFIGKAHLNGLAAVGDGSSADGDNEVSMSGSRRSPSGSRS